MELEPQQSRELLGSLLIENALSDVPLFGQEKPTLSHLVDKVLGPESLTDNPAEDNAADGGELPPMFINADSIAAKLKALRLALQDPSRSRGPQEKSGSQANLRLGAEPLSQLQRHEKLLGELIGEGHLPKKAQAVLNHTMLFRAKEGYLFNYEKNQRIVADDSWLRDVWAWVAGKLVPRKRTWTAWPLRTDIGTGAEEAASDGGMISHPLDLGYMGVHTIWTNDLGQSTLCTTAVKSR